MTSFFRRFEESRDATHVPRGEGLTIERRGSRAGHQYKLLGHSIGKAFAFEPYLITLTEESEVFPLFQHPGMEFIYFIEGEAIYERLDELTDLREVEAFALGSLDHFAELLAIYAAAARDGDGAAIETVRSDVERMRAELRGRVGKNGHTRAGEAHELYRRRELAETPRYAGVG